jgi:hypothetical protein
VFLESFGHWQEGRSLESTGNGTWEHWELGKGDEAVPCSSVWCKADRVSLTRPRQLERPVCMMRLVLGESVFGLIAARLLGNRTSRSRLKVVPAASLGSTHLITPLLQHRVVTPSKPHPAGQLLVSTEQKLIGPTRHHRQGAFAKLPPGVTICAEHTRSASPFKKGCASPPIHQPLHRTGLVIWEKQRCDDWRLGDS